MDAKAKEHLSMIFGANKTWTLSFRFYLRGIKTRAFGYSLAILEKRRINFHQNIYGLCFVSKWPKKDTRC